ncbi:MAG: polysaccharide pyruvyl transferase family protein [Chryseolinea sp.]
MDKFISVFDTSISSLNVGDSIIMDAVNREIDNVFGAYQHIRIPSHEKIGLTSLSIIRKSKTSIVGGSNILASYMNRYKQWMLSPLDAYFIKQKVILLGVGWRDYQGSTNFYTRALLKRILDRGGLHSVRDSYTQQKLNDIGILNVVNTGCPTMWELTVEHCNQISTKKAANVIFTLTDYNRSFDRDTKMIEVLKANYERLFFWVQGGKDRAYFATLGKIAEGITVIPPNLREYNNALESLNVDYIGTRLHAGIRALQKGKRTIIIGIDNRAEEKRKDFGLPVLDRTKIEELDSLLNTAFKTTIRLPGENISKWKAQFRP